MSRPRKLNKIVVDGEIARIHTTNGILLIDANKVDLIKMYTWGVKQKSKIVHRYGYTSTTENKRERKVSLHRFLLGLNNPKILVDHINRNTLDNRLCNLRIVSRSENNFNTKKRKNSVSRYKGVAQTRSGKWVSVIFKNYVRYYLGTFIYEEDAALAFNKKAKELYGENYSLNIIKKGEL